MSSKTDICMLLIGAAIGVAVTWRYARKKYERIAQEEINSVKEIFSQRESGHTDGTRAQQTKEKPNITEYAAMLHRRGYTKDGTPEDAGETNVLERGLRLMAQPYVISPEEFGEHDEYDRISLYYLSDRVLVDDNDERIADVSGVVGTDALRRFDDSEEDSIYVRNDRLRCDYEILLDERSYSDMWSENPHRAEV